ncbi:MAG: AIR synthase-related protein, partial [Desulfovibrionaceae bacterium]|nr:AIR synthase-related protein [Desulfovibrionaceae bacterium]
MLYRIEIGPRPDLDDIHGRATARALKSSLGIHVDAVWQLKIFTVDGLEADEVRRLVDEGIWHDPILQQASVTPLPVREPRPSWFVEVGFRPGVTDNEARTARDTAAIVLGRSREDIRVYTAVQYQFVTGEKQLSLDEVKRLTEDLLCNGLIQRYRVKSAAEWSEAPGFEPQAARVTGAANSEVDVVALSAMDDATLMAKSRENTWALNLEEMKAIRDHFADPARAARRAELNLPSNPTDLEMEVMAQTWSEHCKHKIFASKVHYVNTETGRTENLNNLYKTCIRDTTAHIRGQLGKDDFCRSVFSDNAGVIAFNQDWDVCIKVETHNSPSALDPYGGALTGIVGVNRDPMGTGMGANLLCNTDVFCFASPFFEGELPPRLLHPRRVFEGVRCGVEHGGNKSGIPTVNGSIYFDERYLGKPLVYCGTVGMLPRELANGQPGWYKKAQVGDRIVMVGGRIGKDGIHGATFSSEELNENSPATAVQIGDPITQRKMYDFIMRARDMGLYHAITDNGAGGLSSSVGEMAEDTGGCELDISLAPLKY